MIITVERFGCYRHAISGRLSIDGMLVCGTLENDLHCLSDGEYLVKRDGRKSSPYYIYTGSASVPLGMGNGIQGKNSSKLLLGITEHLGYLVNSNECYEQVIARLRMQFVRHHQVKIHFTHSPGYFKV